MNWQFGGPQLVPSRMHHHMLNAASQSALYSDACQLPQPYLDDNQFTMYKPPGVYPARSMTSATASLFTVNRHGIPLNQNTQNLLRNEKTSKDAKPPYSYVALISMALGHTPGRKCTLQQIVDFIEAKFPYYRNQSKWRHSIRHNLSLNNCFVKCERVPGGTSHLWKMDEKYEETFISGSLKRRHFRLKGAGNTRRKCSTREKETEKTSEVPQNVDIRHINTYRRIQQEYLQPGRRVPQFQNNGTGLCTSPYRMPPRNGNSSPSPRSSCMYNGMARSVNSGNFGLYDNNNMVAHDANSYGNSGFYDGYNLGPSSASNNCRINGFYDNNLVTNGRDANGFGNIGFCDYDFRSSEANRFGNVDSHYHNSVTCDARNVNYSDLGDSNLTTAVTNVEKLSFSELLSSEFDNLPALSGSSVGEQNDGFCSDTSSHELNPHANGLDIMPGNYSKFAPY